MTIWNSIIEKIGKVFFFLMCTAGIFIGILILILSVESYMDARPGDVSEVTIDYGNSIIYSKEDMDDAAEVIKDEFQYFEGCTLHSITYTSDEECDVDGIRELNEWAAREGKSPYADCIIFRTSFHSQKFFINGGMEKDTEYTDWKWVLGRTEGGQWELIDYGHP